MILPKRIYLEYGNVIANDFVKEKETDEEWGILDLNP